MAKNSRLGQKIHQSSREMKRLLQGMERLEKKVERRRRELKRRKKSMKKDDAKLRGIQEQFEEIRKANRQEYQDNASVDAFLETILEAEDPGDFLTAKQLAQILRDLMAHGDEEKQDSDDYDDNNED